MRCWILVVSVALSGLLVQLAAEPALADDGARVEINLLGGGSWGADLPTTGATSTFEPGWHAGGMLGIRPHAKDRQVYFVSYIFQRSPMDLEIDLGTRPPATVPMFVHHVHAGIEADGELTPHIHPFLGVSLGASGYQPDRAGTETTWFFSAGLQGGIKVPFTRWMGLRLQGRMLTTVIREGAELLCTSDSAACILADDTVGVIQGDATGGIYFSF